VPHRGGEIEEEESHAWERWRRGSGGVKCGVGGVGGEGDADFFSHGWQTDGRRKLSHQKIVHSLVFYTHKCYSTPNCYTEQNSIVQYLRFTIVQYFMVLSVVLDDTEHGMVQNHSVFLLCSVLACGVE